MQTKPSLRALVLAHRAPEAHNCHELTRRPKAVCHHGKDLAQTVQRCLVLLMLMLLILRDRLAATYRSRSNLHLTELTCTPRGH